MFEKEAEEYFETECLHSYADTEEQLKEDVVPAFQKGAEFGYNKAKAEIKLLKETHRQSLKILTDQIEELHKANEWHKPSEKLPEECSLVLAYLFEETEPTICEYVVSNQWECLPKRIVFCSNDQVRKWKEIVLPQLREEDF